MLADVSGVGSNMSDRQKISRKKGTASNFSNPSLAPKIPRLAIRAHNDVESNNISSNNITAKTVESETSQEQALVTEESENQENISLKSDSPIESFNYLEKISIFPPQKTVQSQELAENKQEQSEVIQRKLNASSAEDKQEELSPLSKAFQIQGNEENKLDSPIESFNYLERATIFRPQEKYQLGDSPGKELIAHDLNHVVQQVGKHTVVNRNEEENDVDIRQGLIHGTWKQESNSVDLHVDKGDSFPVSDMLAIAQKIYRLMEGRKNNGGPLGTFILHPTGAAIVKIVVQLLGEALGNANMVEQARQAIYWRKFWAKNPFKKAKKMSEDLLAPSVHKEHFTYLKSLEDVAGISIRPILPKTMTVEEFEQNMLEATQAGQERFEAYKKTIEEQIIGVSLDVTITQEQLPQIIMMLSKHSA